MLDLNFQNVEELIFEDREAQKVLPSHFFSLFEQWRIARRIPALKSLGKQATLDFLNALSDTDVEGLEVYFGTNIRLEKFNYSITRDIKVPLADTEVCQQLCECVGFNYFSTWRDENFIYVSLWR